MRGVVFSGGVRGSMYPRWALLCCECIGISDCIFRPYLCVEKIRYSHILLTRHSKLNRQASGEVEVTSDL